MVTGVSRGRDTTGGVGRRSKVGGLEGGLMGVDPESLDYITSRLRRYFRQQRRKNSERSHKELSLDALICLEHMIFPRL